jgi:energy-coupling factor transporter transmembrane protein EcfT
MASLPGWLPIIGGPLTAEAAVFGVVFGFTFLTGIVAFAAFNKRVGAAELVKILPRRLRGAATVISVTFNFIPATGTAAKEIREAQLIRGFDYGSGVAGSVRRAGATMTPLIVTGLEKAITTAESMESRAYGNRTTMPSPDERVPWTIIDWATATAAVIPALALVIALFGGWGHMLYQPYPVLTAPEFNPWLGLLLCLYAAPAVAGQ